MADSKSYTRASFTGFLLLILLVAGWVRIYDLNWDEGTHLHPDERYLTMVASALEIPQTTGEYWSTESSPLNPENRGYGGYVYGTLPLFAARLVGGWFDGACGETPKQLPAIARAVFFGAVAPCYPGLYVGYGGVHLIGRYLSTATDLLTLLALALLAKKLFGHHVALWAAALYAFAVLPIQHAHFFVVDSFATVFVVWTLYFALSAVENHEKWLLLLAGLTTGLAIASKVSTWPVAAMVGLAGILQRRLEENTPTENGADDRPRYVFTLDLTTILFLTASGLLAFCAFRIAQPYAFSGPGFFDLHLNPRWVESMKFIRELVSGTIDTPPGHQWANRLPIIFPWINMVFWGLGIPLGIASWFGWGMMGWRIARKTDWRGLLPWTWGTLFFLYQGIQWVKSMRYLLPVYPVFVLFAAVALVDLARWAYKRQLVNTTAAKIRKLGFFILRGVPWLVLAGAMTWAIAFMQIYVRPFTRIEASQWIYEHIPTTVTATTEKGLSIQIPLQPNAILIVEGAPAAASFTMPAEDRIISVSLNKARVTPTETTPPNVAITLAADQNFDDVLAYTEVLIPLSSSKSVHVAAPMETQRLAAGEVVHIQVRLLEGLPVTLATSILGNEHWDDSLPVRMDGKDPFRDWYRGLSSSSDSLMHLYDNDNAAKRQQLLAWLDEVDFVILSSNRLYGSIARLPLRYPLSIAYYRSLFDGSLGFDLVGEFVSFPALGPCQFEDQETPFSIPSPQYTNRRTCAIPYPAAEEAFSVYDHPRVLIFAKTSRYSRANAETLLSLALAETAQWMTPLQATRGSGNQVQLVMNTRVRLIQEAGGTWSALFDRETLQNRHPIVAAVRWWGLLTLVGWMAFPWLVTVFPRFYDHGYGLARAAGLLAWVYPGWLLASMHWAPHTRLLLWTTFLIWVIATGLLILRKRAYLATYLTTHWRDLARIEIIFTLLFFGWVLVRYLNPDFYHPVAAGEKPMDFAYLNATIKSTWFPPYDPWFAGGTMNYYYFGFVIIGAIAKFLGVAPSVAYNLAVPSLFAMTGVGAYSLAANLSAGSAPLNAACLKRARRAGVWGVVCVLLIGNLGELQLLIKGLAEVGALSFDSLIPGYELLVSAIVGFWKVVVEGVNLPFRPEWWYWNATRIIPPGPGEVAGPINEFPLFTFLYADLHAHAMALPLTQVALGVALQWGLRPPRRQPRRKPGQIQARIRQALHYLPLFILGGLATGALRATNTWDYPTYLALIGAGYLLPLLQKPSPLVVAAEDKPASSNLWQYLRLLVPLLI
ncbi:MAG: DUF2298 domain-containing protein, partial [Anaerolineae bacterium]|nr:DUF2298 domain-containing protein [Anaerolineae bacterium]